MAPARGARARENQAGADRYQGTAQGTAAPRLAAEAWARGRARRSDRERGLCESDALQYVYQRYQAYQAYQKWQARQEWQGAGIQQRPGKARTALFPGVANGTASLHACRVLVGSAARPPAGKVPSIYARRSSPWPAPGNGAPLRRVARRRAFRTARGRPKWQRARQTVDSSACRKPGECVRWWVKSRPWNRDDEMARIAAAAPDSLLHRPASCDASLARPRRGCCVGVVSLAFCEGRPRQRAAWPAPLCSNTAAWARRGQARRPLVRRPRASAALVGAAQRGHGIGQPKAYERHAEECHEVECRRQHRRPRHRRRRPPGRARARGRGAVGVARLERGGGRVESQQLRSGEGGGAARL